MNLAVATHRRNNFSNELETLLKEDKQFTFKVEVELERRERKEFLESQIETLNATIQSLRWRDYLTTYCN